MEFITNMTNDTKPAINKSIAVYTLVSNNKVSINEEATDVSGVVLPNHYSIWSNADELTLFWAIYDILKYA